MRPRVILYARVSTSHQARDGYSLRQQIEALREHSAREGFSVVAEVSEDWSGATLERGGLDEIFALVEAGGVDTVLAQDEDRFYRPDPDEDPYNVGLAMLTRELETRGCKLATLHGSNDDSPQGRLARDVNRAVAGYERGMIRMRTRRGIIKKAREGRIIRSHHPHFGFRFNKAGDGYELDPERMETVRRVIESVAAGRSLYETARALECDGIPTATGKTGRNSWSLNRIREFVSDDVYRPHTPRELAALVENGQLRPDVMNRWEASEPGIFWYGRSSVKGYTERENGQPVKRRRKTPREPEDWIAIPVIVSGIGADAIDRARERIRHNRAPTDSKAVDRLFELSGVFYCGDCGRRMATNNVRKKDKIHSYYRCPNGCYRDNPCENSKMHRAELAEAWAWKYVGGVFSRPHLIEQAFEGIIERERANAGRDPEPERKAVMGELEQVERAAERWQEMYAEGEITKERRREKLGALQERRESLRERLRDIERRTERVEALLQRRERYIDHMNALRERLRTMHVRGARSGEIQDVFWMWGVAPHKRNELYRELGMRLEADPSGELRATFDFDLETSIPDALIDAKSAALEANAVVRTERNTHGCLM